MQSSWVHWVIVPQLKEESLLVGSQAQTHLHARQQSPGPAVAGSQLETATQQWLGTPHNTKGVFTLSVASPKIA